MKNTVGIMREGLSKKGEKRAAVTPVYAKKIVEWGHNLIVQSSVHPETGETKRVFGDELYRQVGAEIKEDLAEANVIFGVKEIDIDRILENKAYLFFSHSHKGQIKNRKMLKVLIEKKSTVIDYELISNENNIRLITAFTLNAGYAGMVDTLWTLGKRLTLENIQNPFENLQQAIEEEHLDEAKISLEQAAKEIETNGTPEILPPVIICFLGKGKTAQGTRKLFNILPHEDINIDQLKEVYETGSRKKLYALHIDIEEIYKLKNDSKFSLAEYNRLSVRDKWQVYFDNPDYFESNLDRVLPYITVLMNCIIWSPNFPRTVTKDLMKIIYADSTTLKVIGDITCDPNGSIEFSKETWIDNPVYIYNPVSYSVIDGYEGEGIAVMAVTNLPCEFSLDASQQFSEDLSPFLEAIVEADYNGTLAESQLPDEIKCAVIMWQGKFTEDFKYMNKFLESENNIKH
jgi:alpha-aminoadipic semialdehyde synthase